MEIRHEIKFICETIRGRLVGRMISEGMKSVKGIGIGKELNGMLSDLTSCLVDKKWNGICLFN